MADKLYRRFSVFVLTSGGAATLLLGAVLTFLAERYLHSDHVIDARTRALLWTVQVRLIFLGMGALVVGWALEGRSLRDWLHRFNACPRSWVVVAGLIVVYAVTGLYVDPYLISDLQPADAIEYAVSARHFMEAGSYTIPQGQMALPPRYAFGYPLLIIPFYRVFGVQLSNAVLCSLTLVVLTAALVYRTGERVWGRTAGVIAALLTLSSPAVIDAGRLIMSESAAMFAVALAAWLFIRLVEQEGPAWRWGLLGACIGAGALVRFPNILLFAPVGIVLLLSYGSRPRYLMTALVSLCTGGGVTLAPLFIYQAETFGGMFRTGYSFWTPYYWDVPGNTFRMSYALWGSTTGSVSGVSEARFYAGLLAGREGFCYGFPTAIFVVIGTVFALRRQDMSRFIGYFIAGTTVVTVIFYSLYYYAARRYMAPVIPLLMLLAGVGIKVSVDLRPSGWRRRRTVLCNVLCLWAAVECLVAVSAGGAASVPRRYEVAQLIARRTEPNAVIISGINPLFLRAITGRQVASISRRVEHADEIILPRAIQEAVPEEAAHDSDRYKAWALRRGGRRLVELVASEAPDSLAGYIAEGQPVYCDDYDLRGDDVSLRAQFRFEPVDSVAGVRLYRLSMP